MNDTLRTLFNHRSHKSFADRPVSAETVRTVAEAARSLPSWVNGQHVTIIEVRDEAVKGELAALSGNQAHVAAAPVFLVFCMDLARAAYAARQEGQPFEADNDADAILVGATDVGIQLGGAVAAAESLGLGTIPIGGIRRHTARVIELLELPRHVFPLVGLCLGYPAGEPAQKPRLPLGLVLHEGKYQGIDPELMEAYNAEYRTYTREHERTERSWTEIIAHFYGLNPRYGDAQDTLRRQGYSWGGAQEDEQR
ncbi:NADPH-dependent oxidoreductase [Paenibacillus glufosinatiresistens]|uniref:NADPH-dependent oxidoreductase n=1 Tax=Paenibacillus glufosinatiresistens TaxID=3070657 RepID=UPI00286E91C0|nr:NADPH-dependent oxidoreductase [Paenibacillus sp. YX.27]